MTDKKVLFMQVLAQLMLETIDEVKGTEYDKEKLKVILKQLEFNISKNFNNNLDKLFNGNESEMIEIMRSIEVTVEELASFELEDIAYFGTALRQYKQQIKQHG